MQTNSTEKIVKTFQASIFIGLEIGYSQKPIEENAVIESLSELQKQISEQKNIFLSAAVSKVLIVLNDQKEAHLKIDFLNYPKFPLEENVIKHEVVKIAKHLMQEFEQNRVLVVTTDETIMLEFSDDIDPRINKNELI